MNQSINNKFNHALFFQIHTYMDDEITKLKYSISHLAVTKSNQGCSRPGPAEYKVVKPLPKSATISESRQQRNLYKPFEPFPGPGSYESKSYIYVPFLSLRMDPREQWVPKESTTRNIHQDHMITIIIH